MRYRIIVLTAMSSLLASISVSAQTNAYRYSYVDPSVYDSLGYLPSGMDTLVNISVPVGDAIPISVVEWNTSQTPSLPIQIVFDNSAFPGSNEDLQAADAQGELDTVETWWNETMFSTGNCFTVQEVSYGGAQIAFTSDQDYFSSKPGAEALAVTASAVNGTYLSVNGDANSPNPTAGILFNNSSTFQSQYTWTCSWYTNTFTQYINFQNVAVHEMGHLFGLGDDYEDQNSVMYYAQSPDQSELYLDRTDVYSMERLYCGVLTGVGNSPPPAPTDFSVNIVGQNIVLNWNETSGIPISYFNVYRNGALITQQSSNSYTDIDGVSSLPASYQVGAYSYYPGPPYYLDGESDTQPINVIASPSNISYDTLWTGVVYVNNNVTISSGATVCIGAYTNVIFNSGSSYSITANGKLNVEGESGAPVTFTSNSSSPSPGNWGSIVLNGSGASGSTLDYVNMQYGTNLQAIGTSGITIENSTFSNNSSGIVFNDATGSMISNTIPYYESGTAVLIQNTSSVDLRQNTIYTSANAPQNTGVWFYSGSSGSLTGDDIDYFFYGIDISNSCSPDFPNYPYSTSTNNRIADNYDGIVITGNSYPDMYDDTHSYGLNSIYYNYNYDIDLYGETYSLDALGDYWNNGNPSNAHLYAGSGCAIYTSPYSTTDGWANFPVPSAKPGVKPTIVSATAKSKLMRDGGQIRVQPTIVTDSVWTNPLSAGFRYRDEGKYRDAANFFMSYLGNHPEDQQAYVDLYSCADSETAPQLIQYFNSLPAQASKDQKLLLSYLYLKQGDTKSAEQVDDQIMKEDPNTPLSVKAELNNFYIALYNENDLQSASSILNDVMSKKDLLAQEYVQTGGSSTIPMELSAAETALKTYVDPKTGKMVSSQSIQSGDESPLIGAETSGSMQNYPNPFNPTTMISYSLRTGGNVALRVYDVLGRKVMTLVNGYQSAGIHSAEFSGESLASGVYFYRLVAPGIDQINKMILLK